MKQNVRVHSDENVVRNAKVEIRHGDDWVNISECVNKISWTPTVGEASFVTLRLIPATMSFSGILDDETLAAFAEHLRARGYDVYEPAAAAA